MAETASRPLSLEQQRAAHAWDCAQDAQKLGPQQRRAFSQEVRRLPARIQAGGLGQALAALHSAGPGEEAAFKHLLATLDKWLARAVPPFDAEDRLLARIVQGDAAFQRVATAEVQAYLGWLVRFVDGMER